MHACCAVPLCACAVVCVYVCVLHERRKLTLHGRHVLLPCCDGALYYCAIIYKCNETRNRIADSVKCDRCVRCAVEQCAECSHGVSSLCVLWVSLTVYSITHMCCPVNPRLLLLCVFLYVHALQIPLCVCGKNKRLSVICCCVAFFCRPLCSRKHSSLRPSASC